MTRTEGTKILLGDYFEAEQLEKMSGQKICAIAKKVLQQQIDSNSINWKKEQWAGYIGR